MANTAVTWPGHLRQIRSFFRNRSPDQMLATAAPWTSPWLPPGYEQNFWNAALAAANCSSTVSRTLPAPELADFAEQNKDWLRIYRLPAYTPDMNPALIDGCLAPTGLTLEPW